MKLKPSSLLLLSFLLGCASTEVPTREYRIARRQAPREPIYSVNRRVEVPYVLPERSSGGYEGTFASETIQDESVRGSYDNYNNDIKVKEDEQIKKEIASGPTPSEVASERPVSEITYTKINVSNKTYSEVAKELADFISYDFFVSEDMRDHKFTAFTVSNAEISGTVLEISNKISDLESIKVVIDNQAKEIRFLNLSVTPKMPI